MSIKQMKILARINKLEALYGKPYDPVEIDNHVDSKRIWATIAQAKSEALQMVADAERAYEEEYASG